MALVAAIVLLGSLSIAARLSFIASPRGAATDFSQDYLSAKAWSEGLDPYTDTSTLVDKYFGSRSGYYDLLPPSQKNPHPPLFIAINRPFSELSFRSARIIWLAISALLTSLAIGFFVRQLGFSRLVAVVCAVGVLGVPIVQTDLVYGQSNGLLLLLLVVAWSSLRRDRQAVAGIALGVAAALKLFPAVMVLALVCSRRIRAAVWQVCVALAATILGAGFIGLHSTREFFTSVSAQNLRYWRAAPMNLSIISVPFRWLTRSPWRRDGINISSAASVIAVVLVIVCLIGLASSVRRGSGDAFWEALPWMLLVTPIVWETYLVLALPLMILVVLQIFTKRRQKSQPVILVAVAILAIGLLPGLPSPMKTSVWAQLLGYELPMYGLLVLALTAWIGSLDLFRAPGPNNGADLVLA